MDLAYLPKNVEPRIDEIEMTPPNYKFPPSIAPLIQPQQTLNLPALGARAPQTRSTPPETNTTTTPAMQIAKGWVGARWLASDPNGDALIYTVEIRGVNETEWKPLKEKLGEKYISWDSTAFPDGEYRLRVTASDAPANPPAQALTARAESDRIHYRQHAAADYRPGRHAQRREARSALARGGCAQQPEQGGVLARRRRMDGGGAGGRAFRFVVAGVCVGARCAAGRAHHRRAGEGRVR